MKILTARLHGYLDYAASAVFALAPSVLHFTGLPAFLSYALAVIHALMTFHTNFPLGLVKRLPFKLHATIELLVSILLIILSQLAPVFEGTPRPFFAAMGTVIFIVWLLTRVE